MVDTDGDETTGEFMVTLNDDNSAIAPADVTGIVELTEPDLTPDGGEKGYPESAFTTGEAKASADRLLPSEIGIDSLQLQELITGLGAVLTSGGEALSFTYDASTATLTGTVNGETAMTLSFSAQQASDGFNLDITPTLTLFKPIDHLPDSQSTEFVSFKGIDLSSPCGCRQKTVTVTLLIPSPCSVLKSSTGSHRLLPQRPN